MINTLNNNKFPAPFSCVCAARAFHASLWQRTMTMTWHLRIDEELIRATSPQFKEAILTIVLRVIWRATDGTEVASTIKCTAVKCLTHEKYFHRLHDQYSQQQQIESVFSPHPRPPFFLPGSLMPPLYYQNNFSRIVSGSGPLCIRLN